MAITYGVVQAHHGDIHVVSAAGAGTTFTISLPLFEGSADAPSFEPQPAGLVLVVDDDEMVRRSTSATLARLGYNVVEAATGETAISLLEARPDRFGAVLLDAVMPGLDGAGTFRRILGIRPELPVVICTGYAPEQHLPAELRRRAAAVLQKPFSEPRLAHVLRTILPLGHKAPFLVA
jgi:CheY-like chemotaxis protein